MIRPFLIAILAALLFGAASPAAKVLLGSFAPFQLAGLLYVGAALGLLVPILARGKQTNLPWRMARKNFLRLAGAIAFGGIIAPVCLLLSLQLASATSISIWLTLESVFTAVLAVIFFKEHLGLKGWGSVAGCIAASILLSLNAGASGFQAGALVSLACLGWAVDNNLTALIDGLTPQEIAFWKGAVAGVVNLTIGVCLNPFHPTLPTVIWGFAVGALSYGVSLVLYISAAQTLGAMRSQLIFATAPWWGVALSILCLHESAGSQQILAALIFAGSIALLFFEQHSHGHHHEELAHVHMHSHDDRHHNHVHEDLPASARHSHWHTHEALTHSHHHCPDLHHRHQHVRDQEEKPRGWINSDEAYIGWS